MTVLLKSRLHVETPARADRSQRFLLKNIDWKTYNVIGDALADKHVRLTYDRGALELMVVSAAHERFKSLIGLLRT